MLDEKNTAVITYVDNNYELNLKNDFLYTLRNVANYKGKVVVLDYGISTEVCRIIKNEYGVDVISFEKEYPVFSIRNKHIPFVINELPNNISNVMVIDGGDIWFQSSIKDIFEITCGSIGYVEESIKFGNNEWTEKCLDVLEEKEKKRVLKKVEGRFVKNSGMVCGPRNWIAELLNNVYIDMCNSGREFFGVDQIYFNYELCEKFSSKSISISDVYNYVLVTHPNEYTQIGSKFYKKSGDLITIVHNAGGKWRVISKDYNKENLDGEQYSLDRVNYL